MKALRVVAGVDPTIGGPALSALTSSLATRAAGVQTTVAFSTASRDDEGFARQLLAGAGVTAIGFPTSGVLAERSRRWGVSLPLAGWLLRSARNFEIVHAHGAWTFSTVAALLAARAGGSRAVLSPHETLTEFDIAGSPALARIVKRLLRRLYARSFDLIVFSSELEARDSGIIARKLVLPHPLVPAGAERSRPTTHKGRLRVGFLGRLDPKKNVDLLLRVIAQVPGAELVIAGRGRLEADLRSLAVGLGVADRITWLGFVQEASKRDFFSSIDVLALPSAYEGFGMAAAEALQAGVPVVVSPKTGIADLVRRRGAGLVVAPVERALRDALAGLATDRTRLYDLGSRAGTAAATELSLATHGQKLAAAYRALLSARKDSP